MFRKDKRSLTLCLVIGDGCLHLTGSKNKTSSGGLTIDHGIQQADYQAWKASFLSKIWERNVKVRTGHKGKSVQLCVGDKRFKAWRKFFYKNKVKQIGRILSYIRHPEFAIATWLMDDGYVEPSVDKRYPGRVYSASFRIFTNDQSQESIDQTLTWLKDNFDVNAKVRYVKDKNYNKSYPFIKLNCQDSLKIWKTIREFVLQFKSMRYKFRHIEHIYQLRVIQRVPGRWQNNTSTG